MILFVRDERKKRSFSFMTQHLKLKSIEGIVMKTCYGRQQRKTSLGAAHTLCL